MSIQKEFPEPQGCFNLPGFVKSNPLNNPSYLSKCIENLPALADALVTLDQRLEALVPGYNISQIKVKFGGLRYYVDFPENADPDTVEQARELIYEAEDASYALLTPKENS